MTRRILATGLAGAALYAAILGAAAPAQAPTPDPTTEPTATATPITTPAPTATATPDVPAPTPEATPTTEPTPFPSPVETTVPTPDPTAEPTAPPAAPESTPAPAPEGTSTPTPAEDEAPERDRSKPRGAKKRDRGANVETGAGDARKCRTKKSPSTSGRGCKVEPKEEVEETQRRLTPAPVLTQPDGAPAPSNPGYSLATPGPARIGVPNFFIDKFRIPPFLLPIYQAAGMQYGVRWEILAAINEIETDYGRNLNISSAGALGWMQFMPPTWKAYGVDANRDGLRDPYNPVDAIFAAARYLRAAGADHDIRKAVFAYNHADWYVDSVLVRAQVIGGLPSDLVGSLTGLTQGRFPVHAKATYAGQLKGRGKKVRHGNAAMVVESDGTRRGIKIFSRGRAPVVAVNDGKVVEIGRSKRLGRFVRLQDVHGNTYTYGHLGEVAKTYPAPKDRSVRRGDLAGRHDGHGRTRDARPGRPASKTREPAAP